jgi:protein-S-isoprenylcysteine O-methyltransferase Ste14
MIFIDPNTGNEMGKKSGDEINSSGNDGINANSWRIDITMSFLLQLISLYLNYDVPVTTFEWFLFGIATIGFLICYWAYYTLAEYYTFRIGIRKDHKVISNGPYRYVMHPGYLGQLLNRIPMMIFYRFNIFVTIGLLSSTAYFYHKRILAEEDMLHKQFGDEYKQFASTRARLVPYIF